MSLPPARVAEHLERVEAAHVVTVVDHAERAAGELARAVGVGVPVERDLRQHRQRAPFDAAVAHFGRRLADLEHLGRDGREVGHPPRCPRGEVAALEGILQLHGAHQQAPSDRVRLSRERPAARLLERRRRLRGKLGRHAALQLLLELRGVVEVVGTDLDELVRQRARGEPLRHLSVEERARRLRQAGIGDVADQHVLEPVRLLAPDRGALLADEKLAVDELLQLARDRIGVLADGLDRARPECAPGDRGAAEHLPLLRRQPVDAGGDHGLDGERDAGRLPPPSSSIRTVSSMKSGFPSVVSSTVVRCSSESSNDSPAASASRSSALSSRGSASSSIDVARTLPPPHVGRSVSRSARARQRISSGTSLIPLARCSTRSSIGSSAQWMSSNTRTRGCRSASSVAQVCAAQRDLRRRALSPDRVEHPRRKSEELAHGGVAAAEAELLRRRVERVVVGDPGCHLHHLRDGPVRDALAVREATARENRRALDAVDELAREARLADPGGPVDRHEVDARVPAGACKRVVEKLELFLAPDEGDRDGQPPTDILRDGDDPPRLDPIRESPCKLRAERRRDDAVTGQPLGVRPEQDLARLGRLLQPGRRVDRQAGGKRGLFLVRDDLARLDPDPDLQAELLDRVDHPERRAHRPLGIVLVRDGHAEGRHHSVAGEPLHHTAVRDDAVLDLPEEPVQPRAHDLRVGARHELRRAHQIDEKHRCQPPFHPCRIGVEAGQPKRGGVKYDGAVLEPRIFKAYDVRGLYGTELDEQGAYAIGRAYVEHFEPRAIAVGRDMRVSAPTMAAAVMDGAADGGADVRDLGLVGTEMVYFAVGELGLEGGICVTASHNPKEYTGMKIVRRGALPVGGDSGLDDIRRGAEAGFGPVSRRGEIAPLDVWPGFVDKVLSFVDVDSIAPLKIVVDAANGMAGAMLPPVLERLSQVDVTRCYFDPDGTFPNHEPNPLLEENRRFIVSKTQEEGADLGVAFDGDADRCFFVDDTGEFVPGDFVTALLAEVMLGKTLAARCCTTCARAGPSRGRSPRPAARRWSAASATLSSSTGCGRRARSSQARSRRTTTSATSRRRTPASSRSCSCSS